MTLHVLTVHKIVKVIESVDKMCDAITKIKSDVSGIPEIKANVADLLHRSTRWTTTSIMLRK